MIELAPGVERLTIDLPIAPSHVHCYVLEGLEGRLLVDTGLGLPGLEERFADELDGSIDRIVVTHFHPDHVGGAAAATAATGAPVAQGRLDYEQCLQVWGSPDWPERIVRWFRVHGVPNGIAEQLLEVGEAARPLIRFSRDPDPLEPGEPIDGWEVVALPGHSDGHMCLLRDGILVAGDHLLPGISPAVGLYPDSRPDPLGDYLDSLERTAALAPRIALPGHGEPIGDPAGRARELIEHHRRRLDDTLAALESDPRTAYEISLDVFGGDLDPPQRRFAVAESLSHLERLVHAGQARREGAGGSVAYTGA